MFRRMPPVAAAKPAPSSRSIPLPNVSYGPFRLLESVPWLMFATALRFASFGKGGLMVISYVLESAAIFLALLLATRRMIEFTDGQTGLGKLAFAEQMKLARNVLLPVGALMFGAMVLLALAGAIHIAPQMLLGFDGIAFDQFSKVGMVWSSMLAAVVFLMVVRVGAGEPVSLRGALKDLLTRANCLLPAIVVLVAMQFGLTAVQGMTRAAVYWFWQTSPSPQSIKNLVYFVFVFGFAAARLWLTLAILTFALRESYRRAGA
jgi:hypothetical protein